MDRESELMFDKHNHQWQCGRLRICYGHENGVASFVGGFKFMWLKKKYEVAIEAEAKKMFPGIIEMYEERD